MKTIIFIALVIFTKIASSDQNEVGLEYFSSDPAFDLSVRTLRLSSDAFAAGVSVAIKSCAGNLSGIANKVSENIYELKPYKRFNEKDNCVVNIRLVDKGKRIIIEEDGCGVYHGAMCEFEGILDQIM